MLSFERVTFSPCNKGDQQNCQESRQRCRESAKLGLESLQKTELRGLVTVFPHCDMGSCFFFSVDIVLELLFFFKVFKDVCFFLFLVVVMFLSDVSKDVILQLL